MFRTRPDELEPDQRWFTERLPFAVTVFVNSLTGTLMDETQL
jgi:hypothetical protein